MTNVQILQALGARCQLYVIDEAHCMKTWGGGDQPFRKNFGRLSHTITKLEVCEIGSVRSNCLVSSS